MTIRYIDDDDDIGGSSTAYFVISIDEYVLNRLSYRHVSTTATMDNFPLLPYHHHHHHQHYLYLYCTHLFFSPIGIDSIPFCLSQSPSVSSAPGSAQLTHAMPFLLDSVPGSGLLPHNFPGRKGGIGRESALRVPAFISPSKAGKQGPG